MLTLSRQHRPCPPAQRRQAAPLTRSLPPPWRPPRRTFPLNATTPISKDEIDAFLRDKPAELPSDACCAATKNFAAPSGAPTGCQCNAGLRAMLPSVGVTPEGLDGVLAIVVAACKFEVQACP